MVQINLPKNSEVTQGKYFQDKTGSKNIRKVNVYRWDPSTEENPRLQQPVSGGGTSVSDTPTVNTPTVTKLQDNTTWEWLRLLATR